MHQANQSITVHVSRCLQLAILLEVSTSKPGNVTRTADFRETRYEHFLASAVAVSPSFALAAERAIKVSTGEIMLKDIGIGEIVKKAVTETHAWQQGGNTLLGTVLLLSPIAAAAGLTLASPTRFALAQLRENIRLVVQSTTPADAVAVYEAINIANPNGLVDKAPKLDVNNPDSVKKIREDHIPLMEILKISAPYDSISKEWVENYPITFETGFPYFVQQLEETHVHSHNLRMAVVHTFLKILGTVPDTLIARKVGWNEAKRVSTKAEKVLELGGLATPLGREKLASLDEELRGQANERNPGTTADLVAAVLALSILNGYRP